jgi:hypothetical protein
MICRACGKEFADDFSFCPHCGKQNVAEMVCSACGKESAVEFSFCPHCGKAFAPAPSVIESPHPSPEGQQVTEQQTDQQAPTKGSETDRSNRIGTYVFGAFSVLSLLVSIIKGIVSIYLVESAIWAGAAWYWSKKKTHSELAKAIVIVLAALIAIGEVIQIAKQFVSEPKQTRVATPIPLDSPVASQYPNTGQSFYEAATSGASAASHVADIEKQAVALFNQKQYTEARTLFEHACNGTDENGLKYVGFDGEMKACNYLGYLYAKGLGGSRDMKKAYDVYKRACEQGTLSSCASLGSLYQDAGDNDNARRYFQKACDGGLAEACDLLRKVQ